MPSTAYNTLLAVAEQVKLWITPAHQTYAELPSGAVPLWSEDFFTWCIAKFNFQNFPAPITYNTVLRTLDQAAQSQPRQKTQQANLRTAATKNGYEIDLGNQSIQVTGKEWKITQHPGPAPDDNRGKCTFLRPLANRPLPPPTESEKELPDYLRAAFGIKPASPREEDSAKALSQWLELALRPDQPCPPLILTGEFRDEAAEAIRNLIDPAACAMLPFPTGRNEAGCMALYNRVLAFQIFGTITTFRRSIITELAQGRFQARLRQADHKGPVLYQPLGRPVIITADDAPEICSNQIVIEIKKCDPLPQQEVLAALFDQMVRSLRDEPKSQPEPDYPEAPATRNSFDSLEAIAPFP